MRPEVRSRHFEAMGTACSIFARDADLVAAERWVRRLAQRLTRFSTDSELSQLNAHPGRWRSISSELEDVLRVALRAYEMSGGLVNAAVLPAMMAIGYTRPLEQGPGTVALEQARPLPSLPDVLELREGEARVTRGLDLGGVAKGLMADRLAEMLGADCLVNLGGDLRAIGDWPVDVAGTTLLLRDQAAATSSVRKRRWGDVHHLIDPRTGLPALTGLTEVSVVTSTAFEAEVVAKTALLLGPTAAPAYCAVNALAWWLGR